GQVVYYYLPWFWSLRRRVRLCQEYVADAAAATLTAPVADYAQFLLRLTAAPAVPLGTTGVTGNSSDLFRRVTMLLQNPARLEKRCPRLWSAAWAGGLLSLAVLIAGIGFRADAAPANQDKDVPKKEEPKKEETKKVEAIPDQPKREPAKAAPDVAPALPGAGVIQLEVAPPGIDPDQAKRMRKMMEQQMDHMRRMLRQIGAPLGGL